MKPVKPPKYRSILARISIWTIINHGFLVGRIRIYIWSASATILFLSLASIIPLEVALTMLLFCGCTIMILLWLLIGWRKSILLGIQDQMLKQEAYTAMLALIHIKQAGRRNVRKRTGLLHL